MTNLRAATVQADDARAYLIRQLGTLTTEIERQQANVRAGLGYSGRRLAQRMAAVDEARELLNACDTAVQRVIRRGVA